MVWMSAVLLFSFIPCGICSLALLVALHTFNPPHSIIHLTFTLLREGRVWPSVFSPTSLISPRVYCCWSFRLSSYCNPRSLLHCTVDSPITLPLLHYYAGKLFYYLLLYGLESCKRIRAECRHMWLVQNVTLGWHEWVGLKHLWLHDSILFILN